MLLQHKRTSNERPSALRSDFYLPRALEKKTKKKELSNSNNVRVLARMEPWVFNNKKIRLKASWARSPEHSPSRQPVTARRTGRRPEGTWREAGEGAGAARCGPRGPGAGHPGLVGSPPSDLSTALHLAATPPRGTGSRRVPPGVAGSGLTPRFAPSGGRWLGTTSWCVDAKWLSDAGRNGDTQCRAFTFFAPGGGGGEWEDGQAPPSSPRPTRTAGSWAPSALSREESEINVSTYVYEKRSLWPVL